MKELTKIESEMFNEYYVGRNGNREVRCILDDFCVRYIVLAPGKWGMKQESRREYKNNQKELCLRRATETLNK